MLDWVGAECRSALFANCATFSLAYARIWSTYSTIPLALLIGN